MEAPEASTSCSISSLGSGKHVPAPSDNERAVIRASANSDSDATATTSGKLIEQARSDLLQMLAANEEWTSQEKMASRLRVPKTRVRHAIKGCMPLEQWSGAKAAAKDEQSERRHGPDTDDIDREGLVEWLAKEAAKVPGVTRSEDEIKADFDQNTAQELVEMKQLFDTKRAPWLRQHSDRGVEQLGDRDCAIEN